MLFNFQRVHPAAELHFNPGANRPLGHCSVELTLVQHLGEWNISAMLQHPSSGGNSLNAPDIRQNGMSRKIEARESLVAKNPGADCPFANPVLGLEENDVQPGLRQQRGSVYTCRTSSDNDDVPQTASSLRKPFALVLTPQLDLLAAT